MRRLALIVLAVCLIVVLLPDAKATVNRSPVIEQAIRTASVTYRVDVHLLRRRAWCESHYNPRAVNHSSGASGLFQFLPSTWRTTPFRSLNIFNPWINALAAAWMVSVGRSHEWSCR